VTIEDLERAAVGLDPKSRARLAERLLESLETLSPQENARIWAEEAQRRSDALESGRLSGRPADEVFREARARI
jgi:tRNA A37 N6-isopentenylltransferase MiaA